MKKTIIKSLLIITALILSSGIYSQNNKEDVLITIAGDNITKSEFLKVYKKNNIKNDVIDKKSLEEYLELYINFKLKVKEAEELKMDTSHAFKSELNGYRKQLAEPYLTDKEIFESILKEAYDRMQYDIRASHILKKVAKDASPEDTLVAYNTIMEIRKRIIKGEDFNEVAKETSDDPSAKGTVGKGNQPPIIGNGGDLGYFTSLDMIYPFENAAFNTKIGETSMPVRTDYGYHLIKIKDKKKAMGKVQVAHIFIRMQKNATKMDSSLAKIKIDDIYKKILDGGNFEEIVKTYSEDKGSSSKGGVLPWFGVNRMVPDFIVAISKLEKKEDISEPVITAYGWHIIKLIDTKPIGTYEEVKPQIKKHVARDSRANKSKEIAIKKIQQEFGFKENKKSLTKIYAVVDSTIFEKKWSVEKAAKLKKVLFILGDKKYYQKDFAKYLATHQRNSQNKDIKQFVDKAYKNYVNESCIAYKDEHLEDLFPEFKDLMKEYRDGILLFDLTDKKVWSKAIIDTAGLENFHAKNKTNYMWGQRLEAAIFYCKDKDIAKEVISYIDIALPYETILDTVNTDSIINLIIENKKFSKGENKIIDSIKWKAHTTKYIENDDGVVYVVLKNVINPEPKKLDEAKGIITADYQNFLEKQWIKSLKEKYPAEVNKDILNSIIE